MEEAANLQGFHLPLFQIYKRPHRKSRLGCVTCKRKRVKCDETRPICIRCRVRDLDCVYVENPTHASQNSSGSAAVQSSPPVGKSPRLTPTLDAQLARFYFEHAVQTLSTSSARREAAWIWQVFVPALAYTSETIRHGMLTLAAMCLHFRNDELKGQSSQYLEAAEAHGEIFVSQSRLQLHELHAAVADSNLASARLLAVLAFAFFRYYRHAGVDIADDNAWNWLHLVRGVQPIYVSIVESRQAIDPMLVRDMIPEIPQPGHSYDLPYVQKEAGKTQQRLLDIIRESRQERFNALHSALDGGLLFLEQQQTDHVLTAIDNLAKVTEHICSDEVHSLFRALCSWPAGLTKPFIEMLTNFHPAALAVYSHWLMLVVLAEDLWWIGDMGRAGIRAVVDRFSEADFGLQGLIEWPRRMVNIT